MAGSDNWNRTFGVDGKYGIGEAVTLSGFAARTETPGPMQARYARTTRRSTSAIASTRHTASYARGRRRLQSARSASSNATDGYRSLGSVRVRRHVRTPVADQARPARVASHTRVTRATGASTACQETATLHWTAAWDFENGYSLSSTALNVQWEGLREPFEVYPGVVVPAGELPEPVLARAWAAPTVASGCRPA